MKTTNEYLIPKSAFQALLESAGQGGASAEEAHTKLWFALADGILKHGGEVSFSIFDKLGSLTPGQNALLCCADFWRGIKHGDFITAITISEERPPRTLRALEILGADEYSDLLRKVEKVFPGKQFPKFAEDIMWAVRKQPDDYFDKMGEKFLTGKGMKRPLHHYVYAYVTAHPEDFCVAGK